MDQMGEDQLDFDEEPIGEDEDYDDLYNDVNVGEKFIQGQAPKISFPAMSIPGVSTLVSEKKAEMSIPGVSTLVSEKKAEMSIPVQQQAKIEAQTSTVFVGELHWWTTDAEIESALAQYGRVKEIKFFDERASGKSKGYCQVEFSEAGAASACKEGMHGRSFNGRACVVAFASSETLKQMGAAYSSKNPAPQAQGRRPGGDSGGRGFARGGRGALHRGPGPGPGPGPMRPRAAMMGPKNMGFGGAMMNPGQAMMGPGFMGRGGGYGGFSGHAFPGVLQSFPGVNQMGMVGAAVAPHVNPAFFGRGMGIMSVMEGHHAGMWSDPSMGGWGGEGHEALEYSYGDTSHEKGGRSRERERRPHDEKEHKSREERDDDWESSSRSRSRDADYGKRRRLPSD